ncbi:hypothetical protein Mboo_0968 [Methanoregula boonei 6A8]|jgi:hypothetical protein|uniref:Transcriptional regulator HTH-type FeoC domain-containing protein n=1 Tax=Methanoregula boonei (strain DSM 21154 / JCM 14090 / 6A8) TaxID=456442 RepID=A7I6X5_METB6|nr:hypothetical protein [Methanoregula boonei]ABS55486.1 hypothetical protein Mboo_0968 [Methanoregula boonei 6A8]
MTGIFVMIARMIRDGNLTTAECAERLGITKNQLEGRLLQMEHQGYLARVKDVTPPESGSLCGHSCALCNNQTESCFPVRFVLTRKGEYLIQNTDGS